MTEFVNLLSALDAPGASNARRHSLHDILVIAFCTMLCGGQTGADMELFGHAKREFLQSLNWKTASPATIPSRDCRVCLTTPLSGSGSQALCGSLRRVVEAYWRWTGKPCAVLTTMRSSVPRCIRSAPGSRSSGWFWGNWPWTPNPTKLRRCPSCWKC